MADWKFRRRQGWCTSCEREFEEEERYTSLLAVTAGDLVREDVCSPCWDQRVENPKEGDEDLIWWATRHQPSKKKTVALDLESLERIFIRLEERTETQILELRYVLCLLLMRKRRLKIERVLRDGEKEALIVYRPKHDQRYEVAVFEFEPERVDELRARLAEVFEGFDPDAEPEQSPQEAELEAELEREEEAALESEEEAELLGDEFDGDDEAELDSSLEESAARES